jgi:DNA-binding GntR family transcriptional regulator
MGARATAALLAAPPSLRDLASEATQARPSTPDMIVAVLREAIISGVLSGGEPLRQSELAEQFEVSIIPIREALRQLSAEGFVTMHRNRGAIVTQTSLAEIHELFDLRIALETMLLEIAVPRLRPVDLASAAEHQRAFEEETDVNRWGECNWRFHEALYLPAGRARTLAIVANINRHVDRLLRVQMSLVDGKRKSRREHGAILEACRKGKVERAVSLLRQHIRGVEKIILDFAFKQAGASQ